MRTVCTLLFKKKMRFIRNCTIGFFAALLSVASFGCSASSTGSNAVNTDNSNVSTVAAANSNGYSANNSMSSATTNTAPLPANTPISTAELLAAKNASVNSNVKSKPTGPAPTPKIGSGGGDLAIFLQVRSALNTEQEFVNGVILDVKEGNAKLSGKVTSAEKKKKAEQLVQKVAGIKSVKNELQVAP